MEITSVFEVGLVKYGYLFLFQIWQKSEKYVQTLTSVVKPWPWPYAYRPC